ncbi:outer membrane protein assembly factor BamB family protein [Haladaptatus salinisoli]|uniref:outer membrane protein assembly factor BamB family protein n=1 Tax=Haladaptatus salinisoli TaxID=2884876 RepID=UPI001D0AF2B7|nr:PQQ-binding-like beta-propeller repeat protein [Haladaptatus salinisoli]
MSDNTRRTFLKAVGIAVGTASVGTAATKTGVRPSGVAGEATATDTRTESVEDESSTDSVPGTGWRYSTAEPIYDAPAVSSDSVFAGASGGYVYAIDRISGKKRWRARPDDRRVFAPVYADGIVYARGNQSFTALNAETGAVEWSTTIESGVSADPLVHEGTVYVPSPRFDPSPKLYAFDAKTGETKWTFDGDGCEYARMTPGVGVENGSVFLLDERTLWKLDPDDGSVRGSYADENQDDFYAFAHGADTVYGSRDGETPTDTVALDTSDGSERWTTSFGDDTPVRLSAEGETLYVTNTEQGLGRLIAVDATSGAERWRFEEPRGDNYLSRATVSGDAVFVGANRRLYELDAADGTERQRWEATESIMTTPAVTDDGVYSTTKDGQTGFVYSFDRGE